MSEAETQAALDRIHAAEAAMQVQFRELLGSPSEQVERLEAMIDALDPRHATGIDRTSAAWWKSGSGL